MEEKFLFIKANVGDRKEYVKIISREKLSNYDIDMLEQMTLNQARDWAKIKGWTVLVINQ